MKYSYKIVYDIKKDMWNWRESVKTSFMGKDNIDNTDNDADREIANKIVGLKKQSAEKILRPYLLEQNNNPNSKLNKFIKIANKDFKDKYVDACKALECITGYPMMSDKFTFCITTFPRIHYFYKECVIFMYDSIEGFWGMPIDGFLHEGLHFQFTYFWRCDKESPVSKLNESEFNYLKEALTVVLDDDLKPIITVPDMGYPSQKEYRDQLYREWMENHDFNKLVDYGLVLLKTIKVG